MSKYLLLAIVVGLALAPTQAPNFTWHCLMVADFFLPWKIFNSPMVKMYHEYLVSRLPEREALPAIEIPLKEATKENLYRLTKGWTVPVIVRGAMKDIPAVKKWSNASFWKENYGNETVLVSNVI